MKISSALASALWLTTVAVAQQVKACPQELAISDDCADVINANACYNKFGFRGTQTLTCIGGTDNTEKSRKACKCCGCVGAAMCTWVTQQRYTC